MANNDTSLISILAIIATAIIAITVLNSGSITGAVAKQNDLNIPNEQCYTIASGLANSAENVATNHYGSGNWLNPCTGRAMYANSYIDDQSGMFYRIEYANGDTRGYTQGANYIICSDGRAEITSRLGAYYYNRGKYAWGLWLFNPHMERPYYVERCSTLKTIFLEL